MLNSERRHQGSFAPRTLVRFIATTCPSATLEPSAPFPECIGYRHLPCFRGFLRRGSEGFASFQRVLCQRAAATTPPGGEDDDRAAPSPAAFAPTPGTRLPGILGDEATMHSLMLRPADSLRCPWQLSSMGFRASVSLLSAIQATRLRSFASVGFSPTERASLCWPRGANLSMSLPRGHLRPIQHPYPLLVRKHSVNPPRDFTGHTSAGMLPSAAL